MFKLGRNRNTNDTANVTRVEINSVTATTIAVANPDRMYISVCLEPEVTDRDVAIRLYPADVDDEFKGDVLTRRFTSNDSALVNRWQMPVDTIYPGEISAISLNGTFDLLITEY